VHPTALAAVAALAALLAVPRAPAPQDPAPVTAFVDVAVIPMDRERVLERQTVIVRGDRIAEMGPLASVRVPAGAVRVDGRGKFLMPGVAEMHAHVPGGNDQAMLERVLFLYVSAGVTTIRGMLGQPSHLQLRGRLARGEVLGPTLVTSGPSFNGNSAATPAAARRMVEEQRAAGYDFLKIHPGLSRATFDTMAATAARVGIPFAGHVPLEVGLARAIEARYATIDHIDGYVEALAGLAPGQPSGFFGMAVAEQADAARLPALVRATREAGVWIVPTETLMETVAEGVTPEEMLARPGMQYMPAAVVNGWANTLRNWRTQGPPSPRAAERFMALRKQLIRDLHAGGVGILLGSDAPQVGNVPGFAVHRELASYVAAGLTPYQALETGTTAVARFLGQEGTTGTVAVGRRADLVLLDANPLADIANFSRQAGVMVRGRWLDAGEIARRLAELR
jgi:imidazolonepropionase-like amidohydrolase